MMKICKQIKQFCSACVIAFYIFIGNHLSNEAWISAIWPPSSNKNHKWPSSSMSYILQVGFQGMNTPELLSHLSHLSHLNIELWDDSFWCFWTASSQQNCCLQYGHLCATVELLFLVPVWFASALRSGNPFSTDRTLVLWTGAWCQTHGIQMKCWNLMTLYWTRSDIISTFFEFSHELNTLLLGTNNTTNAGTYDHRASAD